MKNLNFLFSFVCMFVMTLGAIANITIETTDDASTEQGVQIDMQASTQSVLSIAQGITITYKSVDDDVGWRGVAIQNEINQKIHEQVAVAANLIIDDVGWQNNRNGFQGDQGNFLQEVQLE